MECRTEPFISPLPGYLSLSYFALVTQLSEFLLWQSYWTLNSLGQVTGLLQSVLLCTGPCASCILFHKMSFLLLCVNLFLDMSDHDLLQLPLFRFSKSFFKPSPHHLVQLFIHGLSLIWLLAFYSRFSCFFLYYVLSVLNFPSLFPHKSQ